MYDNLSRAHSKLETQHLKLESSHVAIKAHCSEANRQCINQTTEVERLQRALKNGELEIESLKDKLQVQRESAATSLNRIQKQGNDRSTDLHGKIQQLSQQVKEVYSYLISNRFEESCSIFLGTRVSSCCSARCGESKG